VTNRQTAKAILVLACVLLYSGGLATANTAPVATFDVRPGRDGSSTSVLFDASASHDADGTVASYQWLFGDGTTGSGPTKEHRYPSASTYTVTLVVTDNDGASRIASRTIDLGKPLSPSTPAEAETSAPAVAAARVPIGTYIGARAPDFALPDPEGQTVRLSDFLGQLVLLEFWSSGCNACVSSLPYLESLRQTYAERGLVVLDVITNSDYWEAERLLETSGYEGFVTVREVDFASKPTRTMYGVTRIPHAFLIDRTGVIRFSGHLTYLQRDMIVPWL